MSTLSSGSRCPRYLSSMLYLEGEVVRGLSHAVKSSPRLAAISLPTQLSQTWRVQLRGESSESVTTVMVDDKSSVANKQVPLPGYRIASWIRWIHEGSN